MSMFDEIVKSVIKPMFRYYATKEIPKAINTIANTIKETKQDNNQDCQYQNKK